MKHILCTTDGSQPARRAIDFAARLAVAMKAKLTVLAVRPIIVGRHAVAEAWTPELVREIEADARRIAAEAGCSAAVVTDIQAAIDIAVAILDFAERNEVDHMVIGSTGKGGVKQLLLGSVSAELVRRAPCPVTVVH